MQICSLNADKGKKKWYVSKDAARQQWYQMVEGGKAVRVLVCRTQKPKHKNDLRILTCCYFGTDLSLDDIIDYCFRSFLDNRILLLWNRSLARTPSTESCGM